MPLRVPTTAVLLLLISPALVCQSNSTPQTQADSATPARPASGAAPGRGADASTMTRAAATEAKSRTLFFYTSPRTVVEMEVHSVPGSDADRLSRLREDFASVECGGERMQEQPVPSKHGAAGANLICTWPGATPGIIVVVAHYEHEGKGQAAVADWSGAALLPFLYQAIQGQPRLNTFIFLEAWQRNGAAVWLKSLPRAQRKNIRAVIDVDALGLGATRFYTTFSAFETAPPGSAHLQTQLLWAALDDGLTKAPEQTTTRHWLSVDATDPFRAEMIPSIVIHSVPPESEHIPGSANDVASAVDGNAYFQTYHLMCAYLASLDRVAAKLNDNDPIWAAGAPADVQPESETPRVTFRTFVNGRLAPSSPPASH
ncbi:MAG TPA: M28 family peptidase [Acidobacteriaceae bacterium]|nr:M28 family peptidase [Acidobacteriaceae bacterium]